jgi:hypothetical protein
MFSAMMSRVPMGGIEARYCEVVDKIARGTAPSSAGLNGAHPLYHENRECWVSSKAENGRVELVYVDGGKNQEVHSNALSIHPTIAEEHLCTYTARKLHPVIQEFFDLHVGKYGHSSPKELTGRPVVFIEHISWWFAYLSFDNPLVRGQEMSTRAIWRKEWPMAGDAPDDTRLDEIHRLGLEIAWHEVEAWKAERHKHADSDPQSAFRFAFDKARWALPGSIETGVAHCADIRTMGRVIQVMEDLAIASGGHRWTTEILEEVKEAYRQALPGMAGMWHREAVHDGEKAATAHERLPGNIHFPSGSNRYAEDSRDVHALIQWLGNAADLERANVKIRKTRHEYLDPYFNNACVTRLDIRCSLAAARDWHRHRPMMPWQLRVVRNRCLTVQGTMLESGKSCKIYARPGDYGWEDDGEIIGAGSSAQWRVRARTDTSEKHPNKGFETTEDAKFGWGPLIVDPHYTPISDFGRDNVDRYLQLCTELHDEYMSEGNQWDAMLCLPLGTRVHMSGGGGLQHTTYMAELRGYVAGANWEYKEQARTIVQKIQESIERLKATSSDYHIFAELPAILGFNKEFDE